MTIHIPTIFLMIIAACGTLTLSVGWVTRAKEEKELFLWTIGLGLQTLVYVLFFLRGQTPELISVLLANTALSASLSFFIAAIGVFQQHSLPRRLLFAPPIILAVVFSFLMQNIDARIIVSGLIFCAQCMFALFTLLNRQYNVIGRGKHLLASGLMIIIGVLAIRVLTVVFMPDDISSMLHQTPIQVLTFLATFISLLLMTIGFVLMIKERADECIRLIAMKDRLTGIWNRVRLEEDAQQEIARLERYGHPASIIMVDLDHFKQINDQFGHGTGDSVLKEFCLVVQRCIRSTDILARWGGEEFVVLLPNSGFVNAVSLAERIRAAIEQHQFPSGLRITASLGLSVCQTADTWNSWLERADKALYRAKSTGRNRVENEYLPLDGEQNDQSKTNLVQLVWRSSYESGNSLIDTQHRALFEHANTLLQAILDDKSKSEISRLIASLVSEIEQHFKDEESVFQHANYSDFDHHNKLHCHLLERAKTLLERYEKDRIGSIELLHFLTYEMVAQHILIEDRKYFSSIST